jgi:DNA gyrase subunit A
LCRINDGDVLGWVALTDGSKEILLATSLGMAIRFKEDDIRPMGLVAAGVNGVKLGVGDEVVGCLILPAEGDVLVVGSDGKAKRIVQKEFPVQGRYGRGVILWDLPLGVKLAGLAVGKGTHIITLHLLKAAPKMTRLDEAGLKKRAATRGDAVVEVKPGDAVLSLTDSWTMEKFVELKKGDEQKEKSERAAPAKQPAAAKKAPAKPSPKAKKLAAKPAASKAKKTPAVKKPAGKK